jgi:hypothetical protein
LHYPNWAFAFFAKPSFHRKHSRIYLTTLELPSLTPLAYIFITQPPHDDLVNRTIRKKVMNYRYLQLAYM